MPTHVEQLKMPAQPSMTSEELQMAIDAMRGVLSKALANGQPIVRGTEEFLSAVFSYKTDGHFESPLNQGSSGLAMMQQINLPKTRTELIQRMSDALEGIIDSVREKDSGIPNESQQDRQTIIQLQFMIEAAQEAFQRYDQQKGINGGRSAG